jgi:hypothetical protein
MKGEPYRYSEVVIDWIRRITVEHVGYIDAAYDVRGDGDRTLLTMRPAEAASSYSCEVLLLEVLETLLIWRGLAKNNFFDVHFDVSCCLSTLIYDAQP